MVAGTLALLSAWVLGVVGAVLLLPATLFFLECALARPRRGRSEGPSVTHPPRVAILVPAHDEAAIIDATIRGLRQELRHGDRLLVVADNCGDETAAAARAAGAEVVVRREPTRRGKGYAIAFGVEALAREPRDVVVVVDADCAFTGGSVARLAEAAWRSGRPAQARNTVTASPSDGPLAPLAAFAFLVKNVVRPAGGSRLRLPCPLMGTGMAFPFALLATAPLKTGALAEDLQLGIDLALAGHAATFCPQAAVTSPMASRGRARTDQRRRWEAGHLSTLGRRFLPLIVAALRTRRGALAGMALDLAVPPLSLFALLCAGLSGAALATGLAGGGFWPLCLVGAASVLLLLGVGCAWARFARAELPFSKLVLAPFYVLAKIPLYLGLLAHRPRTWVRTEREGVAARLRPMNAASDVRRGVGNRRGPQPHGRAP